jgi:hypothetical protein
VKILLHTIFISAIVFGIQKPFSEFVLKLSGDDTLATESLQIVGTSGDMDSAGLVGKWTSCSSEKEPLDTLPCGTLWLIQLLDDGSFIENPKLWSNGSDEDERGEWTFEENLLHLRYLGFWSETTKHVYYKYSPTCKCLLLLEAGPQKYYYHLSLVTPEE